MKGLAAFGTLILILFAITGVSHAERFSVTRKIVQLWTAPGDDMRPEITGTVIAVSTVGVMLEGGVAVPARNANVTIGDHATFVCTAISEGPHPISENCELRRRQKPEGPAKPGLQEIW